MAGFGSGRGKGGIGRRRAPASQLATRIAFAVIILFVVAQVGWWLIFQQRYTSQVTRQRLEAWQRDVASANQLLEVAVEPGAEAPRGEDGVPLGGGVGDTNEAAEPNSYSRLLAQIAGRYPHLEFRNGRFEIDDEARESFLASQRSNMRMLAFEVPFFLLVVLLGLVFIAGSLRSERELKRRQQNFMSAVTHEFKTPISTLRLLIETALIRPLSGEKSKEYLQRMAAEVARLEQTSEQVLASARLEQAEQAQMLSPFDLNELVVRIVNRLRTGLEARGAVIQVRTAPEPLPVSLDEDAFTMVLGNLLDNAVKYSAVGSGAAKDGPGSLKPVTVTLEGHRDLALLHVEDEGIGIAAGEEERIFDRFYRSGDEMTRESSGMGLGLHLVRSTVEAMNGWVRCSNREEGPGARFTVVLPQRLEAKRARGSGGTALSSTTREAR